MTSAVAVVNFHKLVFNLSLNHRLGKQTWGLRWKNVHLQHWCLPWKTGKPQFCVFGKKKDNLLHWWAHSLSHLHCLSNTMQGEFAECKQRGNVWGVRAAEIEYDRAWIWWMTQLYHVQGLRMEVSLAGLGPLFLATPGFSWTVLRATWYKFKLLFRRTLGIPPCELPAQRWCVNSCSDWHVGEKK